MIFFCNGYFLIIQETFIKFLSFLLPVIGSPEWTLVRRDNGFYDENAVSRPALDIWRDALKKEYVAATGN
jgi:hypothetical protein